MSGGPVGRDGAPGPSSSPAAPTAPSPASAPAARRGRIGWLVGVVVVVALIVFAIGYEGMIPGVHIPGGKGGPGPGASGAVAFSTARVAADRTAGSAAGGPWSVALAVALDSVSAFRVPAIASSNLSSSGCVYTPGPAAGALSVGAASGGIDGGTSPFWLFELSNASAAVLLVLVQNGSAAIYGSLSGSACESGLPSSSTLPATVVDSTTAVSDANAAGGAAFLKAHPLANATFGIIAGIPAVFASLPASWGIIYSDCSLSESTSTSGQEFVALIDAVNGTVETSDTTTATCPSLLSVLPKVGVAGPSPLSGALSVGASGAGRCAGSGPSQSCLYSFPVESAAAGVDPIALSFHLLNATAVSSDGLVVNVTLLDPTGCRLGTYSLSNTDVGSWVAGPCHSGASLYLPMTAGDTFVLATNHSIGAQGYRLVVQDVAAYTGEVEASVT